MAQLVVGPNRAGLSKCFFHFQEWIFYEEIFILDFPPNNVKQGRVVLTFETAKEKNNGNNTTTENYILGVSH